MPSSGGSPIPDGVDESTITATYEDGVLQVVVPEPITKLEAPPVREIAVTTPHVEAA